MPLAALLVLTALAAPPEAAAPAPRFEPGDELTYAGTVTEAVDRVDNRFRREHALEVRVFVLERRPGSADAAVLTQLRRADDAVVSGAAAVLTGGGAIKSPPATRLDLVRIGDEGGGRRLAPAATAAALKLTPETPTGPLPAVPLDSFPPFEFGPFPPRPAAPLEPGRTWNRADTDPARPPHTARAAAPEFVAGELCVPLVQTQQTVGWDQPNAGPVAWQRVETAWLSTRDGVARRVVRTIRQRAGTDPNPTVVIEVKYELTDRTRLIGRAHDRTRREVEAAVSAAAEAAPLLADAGKVGPKPFDALIRRLDGQMEENQPGTPYREAILAVRRRLEAARRGEALPVVPASATAPAATAALNQPAPDFLAANPDGGAKVRLHDLKGRPVVLAFFKPGSGSAPACLVTADALHRRYADKAVVLPLAVFAPAADAARQRTALSVAVPVYDGADAAAKYGVTTFPRFAVVGPDGKLAWEFAGYGNELGFLLGGEVERLLKPPAARPAGAEGVTFDPTPPPPSPPTGTADPPGRPTAPPPPPP